MELLANKYILIMQMGPNYPFDMIGKAFATLPLQDENYNLLTNFDLYYKMMTHQIAGLDDDLMRGLPPHSDPGVYVCSTDVLVMIPKNGKNFFFMLIIHIGEEFITIINSCRKGFN